MTTFTDITDTLIDINESDKVFSSSDGDFIKVRVVQIDIDDQAQADDANSMLVLEMSASLCDAAGKALSDDEGYMVCKPRRRSFHVNAIDLSTTTIEGEVDTFIQDELQQGLRLKSLKAAKGRYIKKASDDTVKRIIRLTLAERSLCKTVRDNGLADLTDLEREQVVSILTRLRTKNPDD